MKALLTLATLSLCACNLTPEQQAGMRAAAMSLNQGMAQNQAMNDQRNYETNQQMAQYRYNAAQQQLNRNAYIQGQMVRPAPVYNFYQVRPYPYGGGPLPAPWMPPRH